MPDDVQRILGYISILLNGLRRKRQAKTHRHQNDRDSPFHGYSSFTFYILFAYLKLR